MAAKPEPPRLSLKVAMAFPIRWPAAVVVFAVSTAPASDARRECGEAGSICADFDKAALVFVGEVESVTPEATAGQSAPVRPQTIGFNVLDGFKGAMSGYLTLTFNIATPDERVFTQGETVLVYAQTTSTRGISSVACTRTRRVDADDPEALTLRELALRTTGAAVEGSLRVLEGAAPPALPAATPLEHLTITAESLDRGDVATISSGTGGYFAFPWLVPGRYRITFDSPLYVPVTRDVVVDARTRCARLAPLIVKLR